jgi:hypothetical protein
LYMSEYKCSKIKIYYKQEKHPFFRVFFLKKYRENTPLIIKLIPQLCSLN